MSVLVLKEGIWVEGYSRYFEVLYKDYYLVQVVFFRVLLFQDDKIWFGKIGKLQLSDEIKVKLVSKYFIYIYLL